MKYLHSDLGMRERGDVLEVTLTSGANVRLLDSNNFALYKRGQRHRLLVAVDYVCVAIGQSFAASAACWPTWSAAFRGKMQ